MNENDTTFAIVLSVAALLGIAIYIGNSLGAKRKMGKDKAILLCVLLGPLIGWLIVYFSEKIPIECKYCSMEYANDTYYCPRCGKDNDGFTSEENKKRFVK